MNLIKAILGGIPLHTLKQRLGAAIKKNTDYNMEWYFPVTLPQVCLQYPPQRPPFIGKELWEVTMGHLAA